MNMQNFQAKEVMEIKNIIYSYNIFYINNGWTMSGR